MNQSIDDLPIEIIVKIIGNLPYYIADYLRLRLVSTKWNYAINCHFKSIKHLIQRKQGKILVMLDAIAFILNYFAIKDALIAGKSSNALDEMISCIKLLPNLTAVLVDLTNTKADQDSLFNYLNTRPTITSLELVCLDLYARLQNNVKLVNIRNFALDSNWMKSEDTISRLFPANHKLTQLCVNAIINSRLTFEDGISILTRMPTLRRFSQHVRFVDGENNGNSDLPIYIKQHGLSFENLESYSFIANDVRFLNYVDNFVSCCPNLKNIDCMLARGDYHFSMLSNLRTHTNVENLVIRDSDCSWKFVLKVLEMFPMVKNLKLEDMKSIGHNQISQALLKLPNLSLLYLRHLEEFPERHSRNEFNTFRNDFVYKDIFQID